MNIRRKTNIGHYLQCRNEMNIITILDIRKRIAIKKENIISCSFIQDVSTPTCVIISCKQDCGVGRLFRIPTPTPNSDSSSFEKPTPAVLKTDSDSSIF